VLEVRLSLLLEPGRPGAENQRPLAERLLNIGFQTITALVSVVRPTTATLSGVPPPGARRRQPILPRQTY